MKVFLFQSRNPSVTCHRMEEAYTLKFMFCGVKKEFSKVGQNDKKKKTSNKLNKIKLRKPI